MDNLRYLIESENPINWELALILSEGLELDVTWVFEELYLIAWNLNGNFKLYDDIWSFYVNLDELKYPQAKDYCTKMLPF